MSARCVSVPATSRVDAAWWIPTKASTSRGASCAANSWYSTICSATDMPPPHSDGQCGTAIARGVQFGEPRTSGTRRIRRRRLRSGWRASRRGCAPGTRPAPGHGTPRGRRSCVQPGQPAGTDGVGQHGLGWRTARTEVGAAAGCTGTARTASSRRRIRPRRAAGDRPGTPLRRLRAPPSAAPAHRRAPRGARWRCSTARTWRACRHRCVPPRRRSAGTARPGRTTAAGRTACAG